MAGTGEQEHPVRDPERAAGGRHARAEERLPVTEVTFSMAGAASPFGDDVDFPLPVDRLLYEQPPAP
jgi:succinate dehydrogenase / fumarate reductase iron-sulfur subunit